MTLFYSIISMLLVFIYWLLVAFITIRIILKRRSVSSAMAWLLIIHLLPIVGIFAYISLGELNLGKRRAKRAKQMWLENQPWLVELKKNDSIFSYEYTPLSEPLFQLCYNRHQIPSVYSEDIRVYSSTIETMNSIIEDINNAQESIDLVFYIWQPGGIVDNVTEALIEAANRGVKCRIMLDSAGSFRFFHGFTPSLERMQYAGIEIVESLKVNIFRSFFRRLDLRQHRKIVLIDHHIVYMGSMNMVDPLYFKQSSGVGQWIDLMIRMEGPVSLIMDILYANDWEMETDQRIQPETLKYRYPLKCDNLEHIINIIPSGPGHPDVIHQSLLTVVYSARRSLVMTTPYLVPSDELLNAICTASLRGVKVDIIIPEKSDSLLVGWASKAYFYDLLKSGVNIHLFQGGLLHSKIVQADDQLTLVGTVNLDIRSLWLNFEVTAAVDDLDFGRQIAQIQQAYLAQTKSISFEEWRKCPLWERLIQQVFYLFSPLL